VSKYVKFICERTGGEIKRFDHLAELNVCRRKLLELAVLGVDSGGVGFGNLSVRDGATRDFYVTGSATGGLPELSPADCVRVVAYDFEKNWLQYEGSATFIRIADACRDLRMRSNNVSRDSLSRRNFMVGASRLRSDNIEDDCIWHARNGVRNHASLSGKQCAEQKDFSHGRARKRHRHFREESRRSIWRVDA
jgi:hypothetical protein